MPFRKPPRATQRDMATIFKAYAPTREIGEATNPFHGRPKSEKPRGHEEHDLQTACVSYLRQFCPSVIVSASLTGEFGAMASRKFYGWMNRLKGRGLTSGWPDMVLHWFPEKTLYVELKSEKGVLSEAQQEVHRQLTQAAFNVVIVKNMQDLLDTIDVFRIPCSVKAHGPD